MRRSLYVRPSPFNALANPCQQNHVHLISGHRYPLHPALNIDAAYRYLTEAPTVVKQVAPMAWQYVQAPQDGTVWLEWISPRGGEYRFASDGYAWGDSEMSRREEFGGYTIEILAHTVGFRPQFDHMATHARTRYHLVAKHPSANAPPPDPNLWLVHYHQTDPQRFMQSNTLPIHPQIRQQIGERRWLESQGRIERKDFMLHDRDHWPQITLPGQMPQQQGSHPGMNPMMAPQMAQARHPSYPWPQGAGQGPPAKRPRHSGPSGAPGSSDGVIDTSIEDEENVSLGDYFDHLSQRDISTARYMQHHRWMEEIFSSPYASSQIVPPDLGLGLMGALKGLTDGILDAPSVDEINSAAPKPSKAKAAGNFTNLKKEQVEEFNSRVQKHLEEGQAEIERMKREHAEKMAELKKGSVLMQAEKRLRTATWKGRDQIDPALKLDGVTDDNATKESVEDIVRDVEQTLNVRITGYDDITMLEKGGLQEKTDLFTNGSQDARMQDTEQTSMEPLDGGSPAFPVGSQHDSAAKPSTEAQALQSNVPQDLPQPNFDSAGQGQGAVQDLAANVDADRPHQPELDQDDMFGDGGAMNLGDSSLVEGMDMDLDVDNGDIDTSNIDFMDDPSADVAGQSATQVDATDATEQNAGAVTTGPSIPTTSAEPEPRGDQQQALAVDLPSAQSAFTEAAPPITDSGVATAAPPEAQPAADENLFTDADNAFNDTTFDDLANLDDHNPDDAGLGEVDFGMDDSAFEGAMHGMDEPGDGDDALGQGRV